MSKRAFLTMLAALTALVAHLLFAPTFARGESGERKVFAAGAGARALGLGGAYAALADDATALVWNPAGLVDAPSREVAFYTTSLPADGISYAYFGYAHPTLRYGTFGVGALRFAAGGIEGRDDRNFVTDSEIRDSQFRWMFGYASRVTPDVALGGALKVDTHSLAGASATSFGADLGLTYRREAFDTGRFSLSRLGAALRIENVLEPREKLGAQSVADPRALHAGISYDLPIGGLPGSVVATAEWVHESGGENRLLFGTEATSSGAAIRMGLGSEAWSAGAGFSSHGLGIDYAYAPGDLGATHRVSLRYAFGATVEEMAAAARARSEAEVADRLAREIDQRETERAANLVQSGREHLAAGRFEAARESFEGALLFAPGDAEIGALLRQADEGGLLASARARVAEGDTAAALVAYRQTLEANPANGAARDEMARIEAVREVSRARGDAARDAESAGIEALAAGRYAEALAQFAAILAQDPKNPDARRFHQLAEAGLGREVDLLISQGTLLAERGLLDRAVAKWNEALALAPGDQELKERINSAESQLRKRTADAQAAAAATTAAAAPPRRRPAPSPEEAAETEALYAKGVGVFRQGRTSEAVEYWEIVWKRDPEHGGVREYLTKGYMILGMEQYTSGRLADAIETWRRALEIKPDDQKALLYVERATSELAKTREMSRR
jgi:tetratricopeptide (TPR) repeat protein